MIRLRMDYVLCYEREYTSQTHPYIVHISHFYLLIHFDRYAFVHSRIQYSVRAYRLLLCQFNGILSVCCHGARMMIESDCMSIESIEYDSFDRKIQSTSSAEEKNPGKCLNYVRKDLSGMMAGVHF